MKKEEIKNGCLVIDRWYPEYGTGIISNVKKTVFTVNFGNNNTIKYDYPHAQFLDKIQKIMDTTPIHYSKISSKALEIKEKHNLTDIQTLLYDHICRGDFKLRNDDGQKFYDKKHEGFGWSGDREWVKKEFKSLIKLGLVKFQSLRDCNDGKYTSWYFYGSDFDFNELIDASCFVSTYKLAMIKHYLKLEDGFDKKNKKYGDIEFIYDINKNHYNYTFKYKGEESIYAWDFDGKGEKQSLKWMSQEFEGKNVKKSTWVKPLYYENFNDMIHDIWSFMAHDGYEFIENIPGYTDERILKLKLK